MKIALIVRFLIMSVFQSLVLFIKHWYLDTWFLMTGFLKKEFSGALPIAYSVGGVLAVIYLVWAILPIYLLIKGVVGYANFI